MPWFKLVPSKGGIGIENAWKFSKTPTIGIEPYGKLSWTLDKTPGRELNLNIKVKYTPRDKVTVRTFDPNAATEPEAHGKWTVDAGIVVNKKLEAGASFEFGKGRKRATSAYISEKDPSNLLVDTAQAKVGKLNPKELARAIVKGTRESITQPRAEARANGRWAPLRGEIWRTVDRAEISVAGENAFLGPHGPVSLFGNVAAKTTLKDIGAGLKPPATAPSRITNWSGFALGTAASYAGAQATDELIGKNIGNPTLRKAVDGFGGGMTGVVADAVAQKTLPVLASKAAASPVWTKLAQPVLTKTGSVLKAVAPDLGKVGSVLGKIAPDLSKAAPAVRVLGKIGRVGGPAGAVLAGIPDGINAVNDFRHGNTGQGLKDVAKGALRVGFTALGAAAGSLIPIPGVGTVAGAVVGGLAGDFFASLF